MEYIYIGRKEDREIIEKYQKNFESNTIDELVKCYNKQVRCGITGVHRQALYLIALGLEFKVRLMESPVYLQNHILGLVGEIEVLNGQIHIVE